MRRVCGQNTTPELIVRRIAHGLGYRFRLNRNDLPGKPDIVFPSKNKVIFVHGCFWHSHPRCKRARIPQSNRAYWLKKLGQNKKRDKTNLAQLKKIGWRTLIIWECEIREPNNVAKRIKSFLGQKHQSLKKSIKKPA
jgi:DNA mismatch endonuclease (patch repair protein)